MPSSLIESIFPAYTFFYTDSKPTSNLHAPKVFPLKIEALPLEMDMNYRRDIIEKIRALNEDTINFSRNAAIKSLKMIFKHQSVYDSYLDPEITPDNEFNVKIVNPFNNLQKLDLLYEKLLRVEKSYSHCKSPNKNRLQSIASMIQACNASYAVFTADGGDPSLVPKLEKYLMDIKDKIFKEHFGLGLFASFQNQSRMLESLEKEGLLFNPLEGLF